MKESTAELITEKQYLDFVEAAAHDLHAPLRKLSILVDRVFEKHASEFSDDATNYVERIHGCVGEMTSLINGLTELTKACQEAITFTRCDLNLIVQKELEKISDDIEKKRVKVRVGKLPVIYGNSFQFGQLFKNLLENAIKFGRNDILVEIDIGSSPATREEKIKFDLPTDKNYHKIEICDNGIGFNQVHAEKIFEPFVRLHAKSTYPGNGLGLSICKKIVSNHHGAIYAEGREKEGSRFAVILPEAPGHT